MTCSFHFIYWAITMSVISAALILAATKDDSPNSYDQPVDIFRAICEGLALLLITMALFKDVVLIYV